MTHWLVLGGGPHAREQYPRIKADKVIGSNRCLEYAVPDVYWITDPMAIERYRKLWAAYKGEIICNADLGRPTTRWPYLNAGVLYHGYSSGICAIRVALERGATKVTLCGFQGHKPDDMVRDTNDQPWVPYGDHAERRNKAMAASFEAMGKQYPKVTFEFWGPSVLQVPSLPNWSVING